MQYSRAFGATERTRRATEQHQAEPQKRYQYLQHKSAQQTRAVLAKAPRGSRVFNRSRNLEEQVQQREQASLQRYQEQEQAQRSQAQRMTRSFRPQRSPTVSRDRSAPTAQKQVDQYSRAFGSSRQRQQVEQQAMAMEIDTPWQWQMSQEYQEPEHVEYDEFMQSPDPMDLDPDCGTRFGEQEY